MNVFIGAIVRIFSFGERLIVENILTICIKQIMNVLIRAMVRIFSFGESRE